MRRRFLEPAALMRRRSLAALAIALVLPLCPAHAQGPPPDQVALTASLAAFAKQLPQWTISYEAEQRAQQATFPELVAERAHAVCALMPSLHVHGWRGLVRYQALSRLRPAFSLVLRISAEAELTTRGQIAYLADLPAAATVQEDDLVDFDGAFVQSRTDCLREHSSNDVTSIRNPVFAFHFSRLEIAQPAPALAAPVDLGHLDHLAFLAEISWLCDFRFSFPQELKAGFERSIEPLPPADQASASKTWDEAYARAQEL